MSGWLIGWVVIAAVVALALGKFLRHGEAARDD